MLLDKINQPNDIHNIDPTEYPALASEIRQFILDKVSRTGGHLASNLGIVELTMALHIVFDLPKDKIIFDVGHQCYTHKILTGRKTGFDHLREKDGLSGFPKKAESDCDVFDTGHSSTSISMALGLAEARDLKGEDYAVVAVIGDGSLTGGQAFEALNNASLYKKNLIIVLNDNNMSISRNVGGMSNALRNLRTAPKYNKAKENVKEALDRIPAVGNKLVKGISRVKNSIKQLMIPGMIFEDMDLTYLGPVDGYNIEAMTDALRDARRMEGPVVLHVLTEKGHGYAPAVQDPEKFHGIGPFSLKTGAAAESSGRSYTSFMTEGLMEIAAEDKRVTAITAAMAAGTGLSRFSKAYPDRTFDVGIAEQHAVSFASGLAAGGMKPYVCIYSTFLQRAYDQIIHDVCLQKLPVTFLIDRAGIVGADGETHQGMLDGGFLPTIPGLTVMSPRDGRELIEMMHFSLSFDGPLAIRYPRGTAAESLFEPRKPILFGKAELLREGKDVVIFSAGSMTETAFNTAEKLKKQGISASVVNARFLKPFDEDLLESLSRDHRLIAVMEENNRSGALGMAVADFSCRRKLSWQVLNLQPEDSFIPQGSALELKKELGLDADSAVQAILERL